MTEGELGSASSLECIVALKRAGYEITTVTDHRVVLQKGGRMVVVARHRMLPPEKVAIIARAAGFTLEVFGALLAREDTNARRISGEVDAFERELDVKKTHGQR